MWAILVAVDHGLKSGSRPHRPCLGPPAVAAVLVASENGRAAVAPPTGRDHDGRRDDRASAQLVVTAACSAALAEPM
jgi:hypothetical protein